jgi:hypothetical protein
MQLSKFMPLVCAAIFCAGIISVHAQDNPAQAAARAALNEKLNEAAAQGKSGVFFVPFTNSTSEAQPPQAQAPAATPPAVAVTTSGASKTSETNNFNAAEIALRAKMAELNAQQNLETTAAVSSDNAAQAAAREALGKKMRELNVATTASVSSDSAKQAAARTALEKKMRQLNAQQAAMNAAKPVVATPPPASANYPGKELGLPPITAPPLPISTQQETELQGLLMRYEANQISPEEYQKERANILARH